MSTLSDIFEGIVEPAHGDFSQELAQYVIGLRFTEAQQERYASLAERHNDGALTPEELSELQAFVTANTFLMILSSKARRSLVQHSPAA